MLISAKEAKEISNKNRKQQIEDTISKLDELIKSATVKGEYSITINQEHLIPRIIFILEEQGYTVTHQQDGAITVISWVHC